MIQVHRAQDESREGPRSRKHRRRIVLFTLGAVVLVLALILASVPRGARDYGVLWYETGDRDRLNRHDVVLCYGWPLVCVENWRSHWYGYQHAKVKVSDDAKMSFVNRLRADLSREYAQSGFSSQWIGHRLAVLEKLPVGNGWIVNWWAVAATLGLAFLTASCVLMMVFWTLSLKERSAAWRIRRGLCGTCGYDMRASIQFGRCPECGTRWVTPRQR